MSITDRYKKLSLPLIAFAMVAATVTGCFDSNSGSTPAPDVVAKPTVTSTSPADGAVAVPTNRKIVATFDTAMDDTTINELSFKVVGEGEPAITADTITFDAASNSAVFTPHGGLSLSTKYEVTITTAVKSGVGVAMAANYVWSFTTGESPDTTAPQVSATYPVDGDTAVPINRNITATFDEDMDPTTIDGESFMVRGPNEEEIAGAVTFVGRTAVFNPTDDLETEKQYTATITTDVRDLAANPLVEVYEWTFTTGTDAAREPVDLGAAGNFVILAKSGISTTGVTSIVGDIGISPAPLSYATGFSETLDASGTFATSDIVTGAIYAADLTAPTPTELTTAVGSMETAYTNAAGRTLPDATELGAGDISGMTLQPGLYKWGTSVLVATEVTLSGNAHDVWIFQIGEELTLETGVKINLTGGALPENVFWQVAGQVTLEADSVLNGIVLTQTAVEMKSGAVVNGRLYAQTAVTLIANTITQP